MEQPELTRFRVDQSPQAGARLVEQYYPLVRSVCQRYLRRAQDVEDAVQETFCKLLRYSDAINQDLRGWLTTTAYSTSMDLIRRAMIDTRQRQTLGQLGTAHLEHRLLHQAIHQKLEAALRQLDQHGRELIVERFVRKTPLRVIAGRQNTSPATVSRQIARATSDLAAVLRDMGVQSADDLTLFEHFGDPGNLPPMEVAGDDGLRFAPDWRTAQWSMLDATGESLQVPCMPGWTRPIRVGVFVSYISACTVFRYGIRGNADRQVASTRLLADPRFQLVGIVEPGSTEYGTVERTLRDHDLTAGLVDASDLRMLQTLDVLWLGTNFATTDAILAAFIEAVSSGVGLLNEHWTSGVSCCGNFIGRPLMLAESELYTFHTPPPCGTLMPATVIDEHPLLPGLKCGDRLMASGCGTVYRVTPGSRVLITKDRVFPPEDHGIAGLGPAQMPVYIVGQLGRGRVVVNHMKLHETIARHPAVSGDYLTNLLTWLAEPRR